MLAHSSVALSQGHRPPEHAELRGIFATVVNPFNFQRQRVQVLAVYTAFGTFSEPSYRVALVRGLHPQALSFSVSVSALRAVVAHYAVEM